MIQFTQRELAAIYASADLSEDSLRVMAKGFHILPRAAAIFTEEADLCAAIKSKILTVHPDFAS